MNSTDAFLSDITAIYTGSVDVLKDLLRYPQNNLYAITNNFWEFKTVFYNLLFLKNK